MSPRRFLLLSAAAPLVLAACSGGTPGSSASPSASRASASTAPEATASAASPVAVSITIPGPSALPTDVNPALAAMRTRLTTLGLTDALTGLSIDSSGIHFTGQRPPDVSESLVRAALTNRGNVTIVGLPEATFGTSDDREAPASGAVLDPSTVTPLADLTGGRAKAVADYTGAHEGGFMAVLIDGHVFVAPVIQSAITGGSFVITGGAEGDMRLISALLASGPLPAPFGE